MSNEGAKLLVHIEKLIKKAGLTQGSSDITYEFDRPDIAIDKVRVLGIISLLVKAESGIEEKLKKFLQSPEFTSQVIQIKGSNSIQEDFEEAFKQTIEGKKVALPKHSKKGPQKAAVRDKEGKFASLINLKLLINSKLHDRIKANMGKGSARSILNYRTGRFAGLFGNSAEVRSLAVDREGTVTAFYTYMKYPYQTFEPGFKQGAPASRDPRILISKSIRQIATSLIKNRLRIIPV